MAIDTETLRAQLRNFRTRSAAIREAEAAGPEAFDAAAALLNDANEAVRWSAMQILVKLGDKRAVGPLVGMLERGTSAMEAANALRRLTGQDYGEDAAEWKRWADFESEPDVVGERLKLSDEALLNAAIDGLTAKVGARQGDRFGVHVSLPNGREQWVYVDFSGKDPDGSEIVRMYTLCGKAMPERFEWALKQNMRLPYGAIGLGRHDGERHFVMLNALPRATADAEEIAKSVMALATHGDKIETMLGEDDKF